ncbi:MAG: hypothetical protein JWN02_450, partial [Acidobacteria bacterium]|nr:hypothetical protein [Acidobacteriota bacterium]
MFASLSQRVVRIFLGATLLAGAASARVISYSPYSSLPAVPAVQNRLNRHFVLVEVAGVSTTGLPPFPYSYGGVTGQVILFDSKGEEEPRVVFPQDGKLGYILSAATRESSSGVTSILILTSSNLNGQNPNGGMLWLLSTDGGTNWKPVPLPAGTNYDLSNYVIDTGGPLVRERFAHSRPATAEAPFVVLQSDGTGSTLSAVTADGAVRTLAKVNVTDASIVGGDSSGGRWLIRFGTTLTLVDLAGVSTPLGTVDISKQLYGWIGADNAIVFEERAGAYVSINVLANGTRHVLLESQSNDALGLFAIPTADYRGVWIVKRGPSQPTILYKYTAADGLVEQWRDVTAPEIEAIIAGQSGKTVLIQVHRTRPQADQRLFKDPALAVWHAGDRTPAAYDELFMNEQATKGFVHVDPDKIEAGEPFVFDSGVTVPNTGIIISPGIPGGGAGGGDVVQEWGVVRASLRQKLVLPGVARTNGAYGSYWLTDLVIQNPNDQAQKVTVDYVPTGNPVQTFVANTRTVNLAAHELKVVPDALKTLFGIEDGGGAFYFTPELTVNVTSRTYSQTEKGTYGFGMNGIDVFTAARPRFPVSFAGAMQGRDFRTNLIITDVSGRGTEVAVGPTTIDGKSDAVMTFSAPANGQQQANSIAPNIGLTASDSAALLLSPTRGEVVASVITIDNRTNDPTYFPPDLTIQGTRTIPAIGHLDGANNSRFRS